MGGALYWREIMDPEMLLKPIMPRIGALCIWIGALGGLIVGFLLLYRALSRTAVPLRQGNDGTEDLLL